MSDERKIRIRAVKIRRTALEAANEALRKARESYDAALLDLFHNLFAPILAEDSLDNAARRLYHDEEAEQTILFLAEQGLDNDQLRILVQVASTEAFGGVFGYVKKTFDTSREETAAIAGGLRNLFKSFQ
jgi:hypothetical protein